MSATAEDLGTVELTAGPIEYRDEGSGPPVVLLHGLAMDGAVWQEVVEDLRRDHRCIRPTLPLGAHRLPMRPDADLSLRGLARLVSEFLEALDLDQPTLCFNDWNAVPVMAADGGLERVGRLVITDCEAFENYPPGLPGRMAALSVRMPGGLWMMRRTLLLRPLRQSPLVFGRMCKRAIPDAQFRRWADPLARAEIRRDLRKYAGDTRRGRRDMLAGSDALRTFARPVLVAWSPDDPVMPIAHAHRFAELFPDCRVVEIPDAYVLLPHDQPAALAGHLRRFIAE